MAVPVRQQKKADQEATTVYYQNVHQIQDMDQDKSDHYMGRQITTFHGDGKNIQTEASVRLA